MDGRRSTVDVPHKEVLSHVMYPAVYDEWKMQHARYGDVSSLPTHCFLQAMQIGEASTRAFCHSASPILVCIKNPYKRNKC